MQKIKALLVIVINLMMGIVVLVMTEKIHTWLNPSFVIFVFFLLYNFLFSILFLKKELSEFWNLRKLPYWFTGLVVGLVIGGLPLFTLWLRSGLSPDTFSHAVSPRSLFLLFIIVGWEELWFRGLYLNYSSRFFSPVTLSYIMGALFMLMHAMNPKIDLTRTGPALFLAGTMLTLLYFRYKTIWLCAGIHFGNNFMGSLAGNNSQDKDWLFGEDGYLQALVLLIIVVYLSIKRKGSTNASSFNTTS